MGRDTIKTSVDLNLIIEDIKEHLKDNNKYLPYKNLLVDVLSSYNESKLNYDEIIDSKKKKQLKDNLIIHQNYSSAIEDINRALKISIDKNENEIDIYQEEAENEIQFLQNEIITSKKVHKESIELAKNKFSRAIFDAEEIRNDEVESIDLELEDVRKKYRVNSQKINNEKNIQLNKLNEQHEEVKHNIENDIATRRRETDREIEVLNKEIENQKNSTDDTYLTIKTTHTQANIRFNEFVNERKDIKDDSIIDLNLSFERELIPQKESKEVIKKEYDNELDLIQDNYTEKLKALNVIFDVQKQAYNDTTQKIITRNNKEINKINSDFSDARDEIEDKKRQTTEKHREKLLVVKDSEERRQLYRQYQKHINNLNVQLSKEIQKNKTLLSEQEIKLQLHLYNHDSKHIEQINNWRYNKNIYDYERKQNFLKAKHQYDFEASKINNKIKLLKSDLENNINIQNIELKNDLQPIEAQLAVASLIQEREIDLLNTENETYQNSYRLKKDLITNQFFKDEIKLREKLELININHKYNTDVVNVKNQLELEQLKQKRNHSIYILDLNKKLQDELLRNKRNMEQIKLDAIIYQNNLNINNLDARLNYETKLIRNNALLEFEKRQTIISEITLKNQKLSMSKKNKRILLLAKADTNLHQDINSLLFKQLYDIYNLESKIVSFIEDFYKLPAHPETLRFTLNEIIKFSNQVSTELDETITYFSNVDKNLYQKRINNATKYKYQVKHEEIINLYSNNIEQATLKRDELLKENKYINSQLRVLENKKLLNKTLIDGYQIDRKKARKERNFHAEEHAKSQIKILKDEIRLINRKLRQNDREIIRLSSQVLPLNKEIKSIKRKQEREEKLLNSKKDKEELMYNKLLHKHLRDYDNFKKYLNKRYISLKAIINDLNNKSYISTDYLKSKIDKAYINQRKHQLKLNSFQQTFLNNWLRLFEITKNDQDKILKDFEKVTSFSIDRLSKRHINFLKSEEKEQKHLLEIYNNEFKRNNEYIKKSIENSTLKMKNLQNIYRESYAKVESDINIHSNKTDKNILTISENLSGVLEQLKKNNINNIRKDKAKKIKENDDILRKINKNLKAIESVDQRNILRTKSIIDRYEKNKANRYRLMKQNIKRYNDQISSIITDKNNDIKILENNNNEALKVLNNYINNMKIDLRKFKKSSRREQNKITRREKRTLKNSYKFKRKQIKAKNK